MELYLGMFENLKRERTMDLKEIVFLKRENRKLAASTHDQFINTSNKQETQEEVLWDEIEAIPETNSPLVGYDSD